MLVPLFFFNPRVWRRNGVREVGWKGKRGIHRVTLVYQIWDGNEVVEKSEKWEVVEWALVVHVLSILF